MPFCSIGVAELALDGREDDFKYEISCAMGSITVGGNSYGALADNTRINNRASADCELECSMGEIVLSFSE